MDTPDLAAIAAVIGDRARASMLTALMAGRSMSASELAQVSGVTKQTASSHLARLATAGLVRSTAEGRHRYFSLAGRDVATAVEGLMRLAARSGATRKAPGPNDPALRHARVCYDHIAGTMGVQLYDRLVGAGHLKLKDRSVLLTESGERYAARLGIDVDALRDGRRPLCLSCVDWSERRHHLAGAVGAAILERFLALGWARRKRDNRALLFSAEAERALLKV